MDIWQSIPFAIIGITIKLSYKLVQSSFQYIYIYMQMIITKNKLLEGMYLENE